MIIGMTLAKNVNVYEYPIRFCIEQHAGFFDKHVFVVPLPEQDIDGTIKTITDACKEFGVNGELFHVNWPTEKGFHILAADKILQNQCLQYLIDTYKDKKDIWLVKQDSDEFIHEKCFEPIKQIIKQIKGTEITRIALGYIQMCGSLRYRIEDPTIKTTHIVNLSDAPYFNGFEAMNLSTSGEEIFLDQYKIVHIGYVKHPSKLTIKIKEHMINNRTVYKDIDDSKINDFVFSFPEHCKGASLWPIGIAVMRGQENKLEYIPIPEEDIPFSIRNYIDRMDFYLPNKGEK